MSVNPFAQHLPFKEVSYPHPKNYRNPPTGNLPNALNCSKNNSSKKIINIGTFGYSPETIDNTIRYAEGLFEKNQIKNKVEEYFEECFGKEPSNNNENHNYKMAKFLVYKSINSPTYPKNHMINNKNMESMINEDALPYYLKGFFSYAKKILTNKEFETLIHNNDKIARFVCDLVLKFITEYVYINTERRHVNKKAHQEYKYGADLVVPILFEILYAYAKDPETSVMNRLSDNGDIILFKKTRDGVDVELVEMKRAFKKLYCDFLQVDNSGVKSKFKERSNSLTEISGFPVKKVLGVYLLKTNDTARNDVITYNISFQEVERAKQLRNKTNKNEDFIIEKNIINTNINSTELIEIFLKLYKALSIINILDSESLQAHLHNLIEDCLKTSVRLFTEIPKKTLQEQLNNFKKLKNTGKDPCVKNYSVQQGPSSYRTYFQNSRREKTPGSHRGPQQQPSSYRG